MVSSWENEMSVDMVVAKHLHHGAYKDLEPRQGEPTQTDRDHYGL